MKETAILEQRSRDIRRELCARRVASPGAVPEPIDQLERRVRVALEHLLKRCADARRCALRGAAHTVWISPDRPSDERETESASAVP